MGSMVSAALDGAGGAAAATTAATPAIRVCNWDDLIGGRSPIRGSVAVTIGTFDGVHLGHRAILHRLAAAGAGASAVLTFRRHPRAVLSGSAPRALTSLCQRQERFAALGVTHTVLIDFSPRFSRLSGVEFIRMLQSAVALHALVVGVDFRCGRGRDTDVAVLQRLLAPVNIGVFPVPAMAWGGETVSSTRIRAAVHAGDFDATRKMMGAPFEIDLRLAAEEIPTTTSRLHIAHDQGERFVPAEQYVPSTDQILPQPGAYAASVIFADGEPTIETVVNVSSHGVHYTLPRGLSQAPRGLRFHHRTAGTPGAGARRPFSSPR